MAPKSSIIANAVKKTFNDKGTLEPSRESTPNEKAISVADGIAHPFKVSGFSIFINTYIKAGTSIPPTAAIIGNKACFILDNSPCINSLFISNVTKKKKIAIKASLIQCKTDNLIPKLFIPMNKYSFNIEKYKTENCELLIIKAKIAAISNIKPLAASNLKNHLNGAETYLSIILID